MKLGKRKRGKLHYNDLSEVKNSKAFVPFAASVNVWGIKGEEIMVEMHNIDLCLRVNSETLISLLLP